MSNPVIFITNPLEFDYAQFIISQLPQFSNSSQLDLVILNPIHYSYELNAILCKYYQLIRNYIESHQSDGFDYRFEINVLFNLSNSKIEQLSNGWNRGYIMIHENFGNLSDLSIPITKIPLEVPKISSSSLSSSITPKQNHVKVEGNLKKFEQFETCAVGGTFDHLHDGHKILLSMSLFLTSSKLVIGITGEELLVNKKYKDVMQSYEIRQSCLLNFLNLLQSPSSTDNNDKIELSGKSKIIEIYKINDICGPTGYVSNIDSLIISDETSSGGQFVNKYRIEHGFKPLDITSIKVIGGDDNSNSENSWKGKLSSTDIRQREYNRLHHSEK